MNYELWMMNVEKIASIVQQEANLQ